MTREMTYSIAMAAARDAGNRSMRADGRSVWAVEDWNAACREFERLWSSNLGPGVRPIGDGEEK